MTGIQDNMTACNNPLWLLTFLPVSSPKYQWKKKKKGTNEHWKSSQYPKVSLQGNQHFNYCVPEFVRTISKSLCLCYPRNILTWWSFLSLTCAAGGFMESQSVSTRLPSEALGLFILQRGPMFGSRSSRSWGPEVCQRWGLHSLALGCAPNLLDVTEGKSERCSTSTEAFLKFSVKWRLCRKRSYCFRLALSNKPGSPRSISSMLHIHRLCLPRPDRFCAVSVNTAKTG